MNTPLTDSNLALIGTEQDRATKKAAAETEANWEGAGKSEGIEVWRVENHRDDNGNPKFGINRWPEELYGEFHTGDSYIILRTYKEEGSECFLYDIYFWIGSESSQDEYGVAAYKAVELDELLGDAPIQHRELQHYESNEFIQCFSGTIKYLDGGVTSGFRKVTGDEALGALNASPELYHVRRSSRITRVVQVPLGYDSLNHGDAFLLDTGSVVYTWFGNSSSPFEKSRAAEVAHNLVISRNGQSTLEEEVDDSNEDFWTVMGGKPENIKDASEFDERQFPTQTKASMCILSDVDSVLKVTECPMDKSHLSSGDVCMIDSGMNIFVWIGKGSTLREQSQAMLLAQRHIQNTLKTNYPVIRVLEGQEKRVKGFKEVF